MGRHTKVQTHRENLIISVSMPLSVGVLLTREESTVNSDQFEYKRYALIHSQISGIFNCDAGD